MRYILPIVFILAIAVNAHSQRTEMSIRLNSGLGSFSGESAVNETWMSYDIVDETGHANSPYGSDYALSYGLSMNLDRVLDNQFKFGAELGFETLRSKAAINLVYEHGTGANSSYDAEGHVNMNSGFVNLFPHVGYRIKYPDFHIDIDAGADLAYCILAKERGTAASEAREYNFVHEYKNLDFDFRPRVQLGISNYNFGGYIGYSLGLMNYLSDFTEGTNGAYYSIIRAGLFYKWKLRGKDHLRWRRRR